MSDAERFDTDTTDAANIDAVLAASGAYDCPACSRAFAASAVSASSTGNESLARLYALLADVTSLHPAVEDPSEPFKPKIVIGRQRSAAARDFDDSALDALERLTSATQHSELSARICDVIWVLRRKHEWARRAIDHYLAAADGSDRSDTHYRAHRLLRAMDLATMLNAPDSREAAGQRIDKLLDELLQEPDISHYFVPDLLIDAMIARKWGDPARYAAAATEFARGANKDGSRDVARGYWSLAERGFRQAGDEQRARGARVAIAEAYVEDAETAASGGAYGHARAAHWLEIAIHEYRQIGGFATKIDELHGLLLDHQRLSARDEMKPVTVEIETPAAVVEQVGRMIDTVRNMDLTEALRYLAVAANPPTIEHLEGLARMELDQFLVARFMGRRLVNQLGRTVATARAVSTSSEPAEDDLRNLMFLRASESRELLAQVIIEPLRVAISSAHPTEPHDLLPLLLRNPFVEPSRGPFFARGLHAGLEGDFVVAAHLLVPQIEHLFRRLLAIAGVIASGLSDEGVQEEYDANRMLRDPTCRAALAKYLGEDLTFDLEGLLVSRFGGNIRNELAHGLLDYATCCSIAFSYLWWVTLRVCLTPTLWRHHAAETGSEAEPPDVS
jgi:hypothetical protein